MIVNAGYGTPFPELLDAISHVYDNHKRALINDPSCFSRERVTTTYPQPAPIDQFGFVCEIRLRPQTVLRQAVGVSGIDLGHILITSDETEVEVDVDGDFLYFENAISPVIGTVFHFRADKTGASRDMQNGWRGLVLARQSHGYVRPGSGFRGFFGNGVSVERGSSLMGEGMTINHCCRDMERSVDTGNEQAALVVSRGSFADVTDAVISDSGRDGVMANHLSNVIAKNARIVGCSGNGLRARHGSSVSFWGAKVTDSKVSDVLVEKASVVEATKRGQRFKSTQVDENSRLWTHTYFRLSLVRDVARVLQRTAANACTKFRQVFKG